MFDLDTMWEDRDSPFKTTGRGGNFFNSIIIKKKVLLGLKNPSSGLGYI